MNLKDRACGAASRLFSAPSPPNALLTRFGSIPRIQSRTLLHVPTITRFFRPMVSVYAATHLKPVLSAPCAVSGWWGLEINPRLKPRMGAHLGSGPGHDSNALGE